MEGTLNLIKSLAYALFVFLGIKTGNVKVLFYLMVIDSFFGIIKALRLGYSFSFKRLGWGMVMKISLLIIPLVLALVGKGLEYDFRYFVIATMNILIVNEGISCITNILSIKTKKAIENTDYVTKLLHALRLGMMLIVEKSMKVIEQGKNE